MVFFFCGRTCCAGAVRSKPRKRCPIGGLLSGAFEPTHNLLQGPKALPPTPRTSEFALELVFSCRALNVIVFGRSCKVPNISICLALQGRRPQLQSSFCGLTTCCAGAAGGGPRKLLPF